jgi:hypothetical protein
VNPPPAVSARGLAAHGVPQLFEHFTLQDSTGANADIYFPIDGHQPTTPEAAQWSCANVDANNLVSPITRWYRYMFFRSLLGIGIHIMNWGGTIRTGTPGTRGKRREERKFMKAFLMIAANPMGRVLLYRLLIETRRVDAANNGCCENGIIAIPYLGTRNFARAIFIDYDEDDLLFVQKSNGQWGINFNPRDTDSDFIRIMANQLDTVDGQDSLDIGLFHEMLHWFQLLRHPTRFFKEDIKECSPSQYMYLSRCYYGDDSFRWELFTWGGVDHQEMRTILGAPNYGVVAERRLFTRSVFLPINPGNSIAIGGGFLPPECAFYSGDDLSENAYRMAKHAVDPVNHPV